MTAFAAHRSQAWQHLSDNEHYDITCEDRVAENGRTAPLLRSRQDRYAPDMTSDHDTDPRPGGLLDGLLGFTLSGAILLAGVALFGLMLTTDRNPVGLIVAVILVAIGVRLLVAGVLKARSARRAGPGPQS